MHVVETVDLTKIYHSRYIALNALNLNIEKGMVYGFVGPNGAGKSTTFRVLLGLQRATAGELRVFGESMGTERADLRRRIGFLPTNPTFPRSMTPISYLQFVGNINGMHDDRTKIRLATLLQAVDLTNVASQHIESLSTGIVLAAAGLPAVPEGRTYQLWLITPPTPVSGGLLQTDDAGRIFTSVESPVDGGIPTAIAITLEPADGVEAPTGEVYLLGRTDR